MHVMNVKFFCEAKLSCLKCTENDKTSQLHCKTRSLRSRFIEPRTNLLECGDGPPAQRTEPEIDALEAAASWLQTVDSWPLRFFAFFQHREAHVRRWLPSWIRRNGTKRDNEPSEPVSIVLPREKRKGRTDEGILRGSYRT